MINRGVDRLPVVLLRIVLDYTKTFVDCNHYVPPASHTTTVGHFPEDGRCHFYDYPAGLRVTLHDDFYVNMDDKSLHNIVTKEIFPGLPLSGPALAVSGRATLVEQSADRSGLWCWPMKKNGIFASQPTLLTIPKNDWEASSWRVWIASNDATLVLKCDDSENSVTYVWRNPFKKQGKRGAGTPLHKGIEPDYTLENFRFWKLLLSPKGRYLLAEKWFPDANALKLTVYDVRKWRSVRTVDVAVIRDLVRAWFCKRGGELRLIVAQQHETDKVGPRPLSLTGYNFNNHDLEILYRSGNISRFSSHGYVSSDGGYFLFPFEGGGERGVWGML